MKRRNKPVVWIAALVVLVGATVAMNLKPTKNEPEAPPMPTDEVTGEAREETSKPQDLNDALKTVKRAPTDVMSPMEEKNQAKNKDPLILVRENQVYKPTPNPSSTSAQWYKDKNGGTPQ